MMEYNTQRPPIKLKEYGRNIQKLIVNIKGLEAQEKQVQHATSMIELMKVINPNLRKDNAEQDRKIWDDLHIIANLELEFDGPFAKPDKEALSKRPESLEYYSNEVKIRHYGRCVELLIDAACKLTDEKQKESAVIIIGRLMKFFYQIWNKEFLGDEQILKNIKQLSNNQLDIDINTVRESNLFDSSKRLGIRENKGSRSKRTVQNEKPKRNFRKGGYEKDRKKY